MFTSDPHLLMTCNVIISVAEIGEQCSRTRRCRGLYSRCNDTNMCVCNNGYTPIKVLGITYCKQNPVFETKPQLLGQECDDQNNICSDSFLTTMCRNGICHCIAGYRAANKTEVNMYPFRLLQCVPETFTIGMRNNQNTEVLFHIVFFSFFHLNWYFDSLIKDKTVNKDEYDKADSHIEICSFLNILQYFTSII